MIQKARLANAIFGLAGGLAIVLGLHRYGWVVTVYVVVIVATLLITSGLELAGRGKAQKTIGGPEDLDRKGGPYDHLHRSKSSKPLK
ncbi:hypothetical protein [Microlunatus soli]|uniref:Uncharacterized protein n=1 Tax=Microlunatus soli TaxID=630515 RepID=A0A1H1QB76_9ACTN|nr:hypothetical protein [Microlunatus soli]SDS20680.1 hypothetical protein SAMN04489812_1207 [Microlunatus soli]